jgi:hypothetical protein
MSHFSTFSQQYLATGVLLIYNTLTFAYFRTMNMYRHKKCILKAAGLLVVCGLLAVQPNLFGAKGGVKEKKGVVLKFDGFTTRQFLAPSPNLRLGSDYKGSFNSITPIQNGANIQSIITYQKGNTIYLYPYKHKVNLTRFKTPEPVKY